MRKLFVRFSTFAACCSIGFAITWAVYSIALELPGGVDVTMSCESFCPLQRLKDIANLNPDGDVTVKFDRFSENTDFPAAEFTVTNNSSASIYYVSYGKGASPLYRLRSDVRDPVFDCGNGLETNHLHPGESMKVDASLNRILRSNKRNTKSFKTQIGFQFSRHVDSRPETFWAEPITIQVP